MKKIVGTLLLAFLFNLMTSAKTIYASGQNCCEAPFGIYNENSRLCIGNRTDITEETACFDGEQCLGPSDGGPIDGICTESTSTKECCVPPFGTYNASTNECMGSRTMLTSPIQCSGEETCINNYCVTGINSEIQPFNICDPINNDDDKQQCVECLDSNKIWTSLGCISFNPKDFISDFLKIATGIAGGIALLLMIYGSFLISTSAGDPKKSEEGKEIITGTIAGLLFIIFSVILLRIIGIDILSIPGIAQ